MSEQKAQELRQTEFPQLQETLYLDYAGAMPISQTQSKSGRSDNSSSNVHTLRSMLCRTFGTSLGDYHVVFFQNTTHALHTIGNLFMWEGGSLQYLLDDHNSVLGLRQIASEHGAAVECCESVPAKSIAKYPKGNRVFVFPMQSNFSGRYYPLDWVDSFQAAGGIVFLDAASTSAPDLSVHKPDFVFVSLLKLTGAHGGAVLVRRGQEALLKDPPPSGGTLLFSCARTGEFEPLPLLYQRLEAGTPSYLDIALAIAGLRLRNSFGTEAEIRERLEKLSERLEKGLRALHHSNGKPLVEFVPERSEHDRFGPNFSFNLTNPEGGLIPHQDAQFTFEVWGIIMRLGGHCNPGAGFPALGWNADEVAKMARDNAAKGKCLSNLCVVDKRAVGTLRISLGYPTTESDVDRILEHFRVHFLNFGPNPKVHHISARFTVAKLFLFPVAGLMGFGVDRWPLSEAGLRYDRSWKLCDADGKMVELTACRPMAKLFATVSLENDTLTIENKETAEKLVVTAVPEKIEVDKTAPEVVSKQGRVYPKEVSEFLQNATGRFLYLLRVDQRESGRFSMSCATEESVAAVGGIDLLRLRTNVIFRGAPAFAEEGRIKYPLRFAGCPLKEWRWRVICMTTSIVPMTGEVETEALKQMSLQRGRGGMSPFGTLFSVDTGGKEIEVRVGDTLEPESSSYCQVN